MTLLTSAFLLEVSRGNSRSPEVKNSEKGRIPNIVYILFVYNKLYIEITVLMSASKENRREVIRGHPRSQIQKRRIQKDKNQRSFEVRKKR